MATTTSLTFKRSVIVKKLETRVSEMKKEIADWEKENKSLNGKQKAWEKKARAWLKKNAASIIDDETSVYVNRHYNTPVVRFTIDANELLINAVIKSL